MNRSVLGARNLNQVLQTALNPGDGGPEIQRFGWTFRIDDRVIQTENDYNRDVFNGDLGIIEKINRPGAGSFARRSHGVARSLVVETKKEIEQGGLSRAGVAIWVFLGTCFFIALLRGCPPQ